MNAAELPQWQRFVHGPLAHWAAERGEATAFDDGTQQLSFAALHALVQQRARQLDARQAPATVLVDDANGPVQMLADFLAVIASGRCAAVADSDWPAPVQAHVQDLMADFIAKSASIPYPESDECSPFYIGFTSGSTGTPKGYRRHHRSWTESFRVCLDTFGAAAATRVLAPGRMSHSLFLFGALLGIWSGAGAVLQAQFSAPRCLAALAAGAAPCLVAVPSQLLVMLQLAERRRLAPMPAVRLILISGARWMRQHTPALQALFPQARIVEFYGASEASFIAWMDARSDAPAQQVGRPFSNVRLQIRDGVAPSARVLGPGEVGSIFIHSPMLFMDYVGGSHDATAAVRLDEADGEWLSVRDMGSLHDDGMLTLVGREKRMLVTQGKNLFPEEVEAVLCEHPGIAAASVQGLQDALRGQLVAAVVQPVPGAAPPSAAELQHWCRERLEAFKTPRRFFVAQPLPQTASGKPDHAAIAQWLHNPESCPSPLP
ncbi:MAG: AMP-binding protein [Comamonas sp.]